MGLCLEKELRYDNPGRHDPKQQAMRINDSSRRLQTCSGASGAIESGPSGTRLLSARAYLSSATPLRSRAVSPFFVT